MKHFYSFALAILFQVNSYATTWNVQVANFSFSPATVNAVIGDVIQFNWVSGFHTTTCGSGLPGTSLPAGAAPWDSPIRSTNATFSYTVTVAGNYFYGCTPHFSGGTGMVGNIVVSGTLPIALGRFNLANVNNSVVLNWETFSESNTRYFSIRKSTDGSRFQEVGQLDAAGKSSRTLNYQFIDYNPGKKFQYLYYELVTVDLDGKESHSPIKVIKNPGVSGKLIVALSPNPISKPGQLQVQFNADKNGAMEVSVFNVEGKLVLKERMAAFFGLNNAHLHVCELPKGMYTIRFELENNRESKKIMVN